MEIRDCGLGVILCNLCVTDPKAHLLCHVQVALAQAGRATQDCHSFVSPPHTIALCRGSAHILYHLLSMKSIQITFWLHVLFENSFFKFRL